MKPLIALLCVVATCVTHSSLEASDVASLRIAHGILLAALDSGDIARMERGVHPQALGFFRLSQLPVKLTKENGVKEMGPAIAADHARFANTTFDSKYVVAGNTGIVVSRMALTPKDKRDKNIALTYTRVTDVYTYLEGRWLLVSWHTSDAPLKAK